MENFKKALLIRNGNVVGAIGDKYFSTAPLGTVLAYAGQTAPRGYLLADGASYPTADYPDLYAVIGNIYGGDDVNFNVPDYRETVLVGVGENTTDTITSHDVYGLGEFKDDQFQGHWHNLGNLNGTVTVALGASIKGSNVQGANPGGENRYTVDLALDAIADGTNGEPRVGTTTHSKQKGVTYIIKAFHTNEGTDSGVSDDVVEYVAGEIAEVENKIDGLISDTDLTSTTSTLSASKIRGSVTHGFNTQDGKVKYLKLKLDIRTISVVDIYGGKIEILGANNSVANPDYKTVKVVRHSYGNWSSYDATQVPSVVNTKIGNLYYYPTDNYYYLQLNNYANFTVTGALIEPEIVTNLPAETSAMTLIPESVFVSKSDLAAQTANRQVKTFDNSGSSTEKWYKLCSAITGGIGCNIKLTASRADSTATVQYFSALFRDNRYRYTSTYIAREKTVYESGLFAEYSAYIVADANNDIWVHVPSYGKAIIEIDTRAITIDGAAGTPVKDYVYNSFRLQTIDESFERINIKQFNQPGSNTIFKYVTITSTGSGLGGLELNVSYAGKYMFSTPKSTPVYFGSSSHKGYTLNGWAWSDDGKTLYLRVAGFAPFSISVLGSVPSDTHVNNVATISDMTSTVPEGVTFVSTPVYSNAVIDNSSTGDTNSTWSSSKIAEYVAENAAPSYSGTVIPTSIANGATVTTDWNISSAGNNADYGRLLMLNSSAGTFLIHIKGNVGNTSIMPTPTVISSIGNSQSATWSSSFELSISSNKLRIKNKSGAVASWRFV